MTTAQTYQQPDAQGYYGQFGGAYIPEMLHRNVEELKEKYLDIMYETSFQKEFQLLLKDYDRSYWQESLAKHASSLKQGQDNTV
jgi:tryptophan synthase beta chain